MMARATSRISSSVKLDSLELDALDFWSPSSFPWTLDLKLELEGFLDVLELEPSRFFWRLDPSSDFWTEAPVFPVLELDTFLLELDSWTGWILDPLDVTSSRTLENAMPEVLELEPSELDELDWTGWTLSGLEAPVFWNCTSDSWTLELELESVLLDPPLDWTLKLDALDFLDPPASSFTDVLELDVVFWTGWTLELDFWTTSSFSSLDSLELDSLDFLELDAWRLWTISREMMASDASMRTGVASPSRTPGSP
jgi:hypothetical protein